MPAGRSEVRQPGERATPLRVGTRIRRAKSGVNGQSVRRQALYNPCLPCDGSERWIYYWRDEEAVISEAQTRAIQNYRSRLGERGLARFEVLGRDGDRNLIRSLARKLAEDTPEASELRAMVSRSITGEPRRKGGILAALRRSPLVGADIDATRSGENGRKVDL